MNVNHYTGSVEGTDMVSIATVIAVVVTLTVVGSIAAVSRLDQDERSWGDRLRERFVMGVPWGSLVVIVFILFIYLFVQDGISDFHDPVTIPFRAWSYFYPLGMVTAGLSHAGSSHLIGNLLGTLVVAPIAEYAWGHYPDERDAQSVGSWRTNPWVRALLVFPVAVIGVALLTSFFALGPVIGFSGVVFAFAGFAIVHYPIVTIVATLGVQGVLRTVYRALESPITVSVAQPSPPAPPSWATIAIQGHALGFFIGVVLGVLILRRRGTRPDAFRVWLAVLVYGFSSSLWAIYWFGGENTYILYRGPGVVVVTILTLVVTLAVAGSETSLLPRRPTQFIDRLTGTRSMATDRVLELGCRDGSGGGLVDRPDRLRAIAGGPRSTGSTLSALSQQRAAFLGVLVVFACLAGIAIPVNLLVLEESTAASNSTVEIEDYSVTYAENVENQLVTGIPIERLQETQGLDSSGVIVASERRGIWHEAVTSQRLAFTGEETVYVGGPGWREAVHVERTGWEPVGNETVYQVRVREDGGDNQIAYESNSSQADVTIDDRTVAVVSDEGRFVFEVSENDSSPAASTQVPTENETADAGGITLERDGTTVYASSDGTKVAIAREETYD